MEQLLAKLTQVGGKVHSLRKTCKENNIRISILNGLNTKKMREIYSRLQKHYQQNPEKGKSLWFQSQSKLFNWVLISYSFVTAQKIENFSQQDWLFLKRIFPGKDIYTFKYESKKLLHKDFKKQRLWNSEEDEILTTIMINPLMKNKWSEVARIFLEISGQRFFRTGKQCREHWLNHLDPSKRHGKWTVQEDLVILKYVILSGKKWSTISKEELPHRTEHMIKNRFKSLLSRFQKVTKTSEDNENLCIRLMIEKFEKRNGQNSSKQNFLKDEEIEMLEEREQFSAIQADVKVKMDDQMQCNPVVSEICKFEKIHTSKQLAGEEMQLANQTVTTPSSLVSQYPVSPSMFSLYYQPSFVCFPMGSCWNFCTGYVELHPRQQE